MPNTDGCHPLKYRKTLIRYFIRKRSKYWEKTAQDVQLEFSKSKDIYIGNQKINASQKNESLLVCLTFWTGNTYISNRQYKTLRRIFSKKTGGISRPGDTGTHGGSAQIVDDFSKDISDDFVVLAAPEAYDESLRIEIETMMNIVLDKYPGVSIDPDIQDIIVDFLLQNKPDIEASELEATLINPFSKTLHLNIQTLISQLGSLERGM